LQFSIPLLNVIAEQIQIGKCTKKKMIQRLRKGYHWQLSK
jgi:hypothetical protein